MTGKQTPRINICPEYTQTDGKNASMLMGAYGVVLDPWQELVVDAWLSTDNRDNYIVSSGGLSVPRQNGKNVCIEAREFYGLVINGEKILHTAHQVRTSKKSFRRLVQMFSDKKHPEIIDLVKNIRYTNGEEAIELENGGVIEFIARSRQAARGFDGISLVVYDEAQELTEDQAEAIMSVLSASKTNTRQIIYAGTPPYPNCDATVFRRMRQACIDEAGKNINTSHSWHEWSINAKSIDDNIDISDISMWYDTNPALGSRLTVEFTQEEFTTLSKDGFMRERLGWWSPAFSEKTDHAINYKKWELCASEDLKPNGKTAYGIKFSVDGSEVCLCGAVIDEKTLKARISIIEYKSTSEGLKWLAEWLKNRYNVACCVVIDGKSGAEVLIDKIVEVWKFKGSIIRPNSYDITTASSLLVNEINEQSLTWYKHQDILDDSAKTTTKRIIGHGWGFGGANSLPIEACSLALWGVRTSKRNPTKKMRIG